MKDFQIKLCVLISFIYNIGLTIKPIKGPPLGVYIQLYMEG